MKIPGHMPFRTLMAVCLFLFHLPVYGIQGENDLRILPKPSSLIMNTGRLDIDGGFNIAITGKKSSGIEDAAERFLVRLQKRTGIPLVTAHVTDPESAVLRIHCTGQGEQIPSVRIDESYSLEIVGKQARLSAPSPPGIYYGLETFLQLIDMDSRSFFVPSLKIEDHPRFQWRGLLIDVSRHFEPVEMIKRNLDAMAAVKMNVLHWHLSDDQGFRVESKVFPKLHQLGSDGEYYLQSEVLEIIDYARNRGIRIIPEFDMPGHSTSWLVGYPELAAAPGPYTIERQWGVFEPCLDPSKESVYDFLDAFIGEMAALFPDEHFHIGGDEVHPGQWNSSAGIREFKEQNNLADNHELQEYFNRRVLEILTRHGKKMIGWDEIVHPELPKNIIVQSWRRESHAKTIRQGYSGILSRGYYLDHMLPASFHYAIDPLGEAGSGFSEDEKDRILGGEACMWSEFVNPENIESRIWPRAAAIAERLWSPASVNDSADLYRRLEFIDRELTRLGLKHHTLYHERMQRLAGNMDPHPLLTFADLLVPPILSIRKRAQTYYSYTPLNRLVDVILPESRIAREFSDLVDRRLNSLPGSDTASKKIRESLESWMANDAPLQSVIANSYLLKETGPLAETVAELCRRGLEALDYMESGRNPSRAWLEATGKLLKQAETPQAEIHVAILDPIKKMIQEAGGMP